MVRPQGGAAGADRPAPCAAASVMQERWVPVLQNQAVAPSIQDRFDPIYRGCPATDQVRSANKFTTESTEGLELFGISVPSVSPWLTFYGFVAFENRPLFSEPSVAGRTVEPLTNPLVKLTSSLPSKTRSRRGGAAACPTANLAARAALPPRAARGLSGAAVAAQKRRETVLISRRRPLSLG